MRYHVFFGKMKTINEDKRQCCYLRVAADKKPKEKKKVTTACKCWHTRSFNMEASVRELYVDILQWP